MQSIFYGLSVDIISVIVEKLLPLVSFIDIYYSYFLDPALSTTPLHIGIYWDEELQKLSPVEFIDLIEGSYPAICCHAHIHALSIKTDTLFMIDHCPGLRPSIAVESVIKNTNTRFLFRGDQCNCALSVADIICKYIDQQSLNNGYRLNKDIITKLGFDLQRSNTTFIGPKWLNQIKPSKNIILDINHKYPLPIYFFFLDNKGAFEKDSKEILEKSPLFNLALNKASFQGGSVKFFEPNDLNYITKHDFLIFHNELSSKKIDELISLGCQATKINATNFS